MNNVIPVTFTSPNTCVSCRTNNIELIDYFGNQLNYSLLVKLYNEGKDISNRINKKNIYYMICKKCGRKYNINWIDSGTFPVPMYNKLDIETFKYNFINE